MSNDSVAASKDFPEMDGLFEKLNALLQSKNLERREFIQVFRFETDRAPDGVWEEFIGKYERMVEFVSPHWGLPAFEGSWDSEGFPDWHHEVARLACWNRQGQHIYIECDQQDAELPIAIAIGARNRSSEIHRR